MLINIICLKYMEENTTELMVCDFPDNVVRYNGGEKCDLLLGPCSCGAMHYLGEIYDDDRFEWLNDE